MKKVLRLTESELIRIVKRIVESDDEIRSRMKRRFDGLQNLIQQEVDNEDEPESYSDAFEYASNILSYAVDEFISLPGNEYMADRYDEVLDYAKEEFGEDVMDVFRELVGDDMGDFEDEDEMFETLYEDVYGSVQSVDYEKEFLNEAEYQGRKVQLGKVMQGDVKKSKVYVKNDKGKVVKVNFGFGGTSAKGKRMTIKKNDPARRKAFRARHNCENPGPRWKPRYWSCRAW
jgi:hypothetical protein